MSVRAKPANRMIQRYIPNAATLALFAQAADVGASSMDTLTNSTTGTAATTTFAAGVGVSTWFFTHTFIGGTSAIDVLTDWTPGYKFKILSLVAATSVLLVGAAGSRVFNLEIGSTDVTGGVLTIPIANAAVGVVTAATAITALNTGTAAQTISIELQNGGTQFTAGMITFAIKVQNMDVADAIAGIYTQLTAAKADLNEYRTNLRTAQLMA